MRIPIDKDIPIPQGKYSSYTYPWDQMNVGDSFLFPGVLSESTCRVMVGARNRRCSKTKFIIRKVEGKHFRCWRVK